MAVLHGRSQFSLSCGCVIAFKLHTFGKMSTNTLLCFTSNTPFSSLRTTLALNLAFLDEHNGGFMIETSKQGLRGNEHCISVYCTEQAQHFKQYASFCQQHSFSPISSK